MLKTADIYDRVREAAQRYEPAAIMTIVRGPGTGRKMAIVGEDVLGVLGSDALNEQVKAHVEALIDAERSETVSVELPDGEIELFYDVYPAPPTLVIFGAVHAAQSLTALAKTLGYRVLVSDARAKLATEERFPDADEVTVAWPDEALATYCIGRNTYVAILTHDPKFDEPALVGTLETKARYIG